jgi:hypothetical protein
MNHTEAIDKNAVERYLGGELSSVDSDEFEAHFFECAVCAEELRSGAIFEENARAVFREDARSEPAGESQPKVEKRRLFSWAEVWKPWTAAPALAAVALLCVSAYQAFVVIPGLRQQLHEAVSPQPMASFVLPALSRGDDRVVEVARDKRFYALEMDPAWSESYSEFQCSIQNDSGEARLAVRVPAPAPGKPLQILISRNQLPSGRYTVVVRNSGQPEKELGRYSLILKLD